MTGPKKHGDYLRKGTHRMIRELEHDPYHSKRKLSEPTVCPDCGAVFHEGRWAWGEAPADANRASCPACQRVQDRVPAGFLTVRGSFLQAHREELMNLIRNVEEREKAEHPLKRIMGFEEQDDGLVVTFTDPHLARAAGEALEHAYEGELDFAYQEGEYLLRVFWKR